MENPTKNALITTKESGMLSTIDKSIVDEAIAAIQKRHTEVSLLKTPKPFILKILGHNYVKLPYMRKVADTHYPGWSWEIVSYNTQVDKNGVAQFILVHGRLKWYENGLWRSGDMVAAHRIQKKTGSTTDLVNPGNDIKAANTDCMKKAMNVFMNIADDVYEAQAEDPELSDDQKEEILIKARKLNREIEFIGSIEDGTIHSMNLKGSHAKLDRLITEKEKEI